ncbi:cytochrome P450 [Parathielavia hyrcaniae]|uniref:Cytochrome P450 n=1 Tax=Parathielavia hyrcaniae TaxID=113614 RepID=A0AAN6Q4H4_9PEZI|nr:cytochrome P450 [Parathielavia hyrcaniae]
MAQYPSDMFPLSICTWVLQRFPHLEKNGFILIDAWPFMSPMLYVFDPEMSTQFTQVQSLPKSNDIKSEFRPLTGSKDLVTLDGPEWKFWRSVFNPGFSTKNLVAMTPAFLEEVRVFVDKLRAAAQSGEVLKIEGPATSLTIDVIARSVLGARLHSQTKEHPLQWALAKQISWLSPEYTPPSILKLVNPVRPILQWYYNRVIRNALAPSIRQNLSTQADGGGPGHGETKTVLSLAAKAYLAEKPQNTSSAQQANDEFASLAIPHLVMFLFAGHDTTATTLCFAYHLLHKHPPALARLRAEHDAVLCPDPSQAESQLTLNPQLLINALPYTTAVIKETLRLFAPAATVRQGQRGFFLTHPATGARYATEGMFVHQNSHATHHLASCGFPRPWEFLPERFLAPAAPAAEGDDDDDAAQLHVSRKNAFRPFELGPRACIGQELALLELKMILALTVRVFEIETYPAGAPAGAEVLGTYAVGHVSGHPKGGMPARVRVRV